MSVKLSKEKYDEVEKELVDMLEYFVSAQETVASRIYQMVINFSGKDAEPDEDYGTYNTWKIMPKISEILGYTSEDFCADERVSFEDRCSLDALLDGISSAISDSNTTMRSLQRSKAKLEKVRAGGFKNDLPENRIAENLKSENEYELIIKKAQSTLRKDINKDEPYAYFSVSRDVRLYAVDVGGREWALDASYLPNSRNLHNKINHCVRKDYVKLCVKPYSRWKEDSADDVTTERSPETIIWENPNEVIQTTYEFKTLL
jgi:hypothetical protein